MSWGVYLLLIFVCGLFVVFVWLLWCWGGVELYVWGGGGGLCGVVCCDRGGVVVVGEEGGDFGVWVGSF
uniref:Transmembrane protein n=1 Tax=Knipowitschia caucasica TaxID=637954 RepID=A0AAV2JP42_KNICA